jgi:RNA polymerase sigma-70 factor (ECF subfamily)
MTETQTGAPDHAVRPDRPPASVDFDALYRDSRDDLFAYLAYLVGDRSLAEELTAQAFEKAFRRRSQFRPARGDLRGWLFGIARNAAIDELRRGGRETTLELAAEPATAEPQTAADDRMVVASALRGLQARDRELIALKFFAGLENDQIARVLRISRSNAGTQLHRAIGRLRDRIGGNDDLL